MLAREGTSLSESKAFLPSMNTASALSVLFLTVVLKIGSSWKFLGRGACLKFYRYLERGYIERQEVAPLQKGLWSRLADTYLHSLRSSRS